jgi:hypothetical protein
MADLEPHPLVLAVAFKLGQDADSPLHATAEAAAPHAPPQRGQAAPHRTDEQLAEALEKTNALAKEYANQPNLPGLSLFAGLIGGDIPHESKTWRLVYLDSRLQSWMLVPKESVIFEDRVSDVNAPRGKRDLLWVDSTANLITGNGPRTNDGRFLVGQLTRAGDFAPATSGGTFSAASALLCEATTPGCCMWTRTRC